MDSVLKEAAAELTVDEALDYLRGLPHFLVVMETLDARKREIEIGLGNATQETALRQCGQLSECAYILDILRG